MERAGYLFYFVMIVIVNGHLICDKTSDGKTTAVLLGGAFESKTETYPCNLAIGDVQGDIVGLGAAVLNGQIIFCGGTGGSERNNCYKNEGLDWIEIASMNIKRYFFTMTTLEDKILAIGGYNTAEKLNTMELFDGTSWTLLPFNLTSERGHHCTVPLSVTEFLVIEGSFGNMAHSRVEIYDINQGFIQELPELPTPRIEFGCALYNNEVWVAGGAGADFSLTTLVEIFNLASRTWRTGPRMGYAREGLTLEVVGDELIAFGGYGYPDSLQRFNGENWIFGAEPMQYHHYLHTSVVISC